MRGRRSIRQAGHDYSGGGTYFITLVAQDRLPLFGRIHEGEVHRDAAGEIARQALCELPTRFPEVRLGPFVIMPDHAHFILKFHGDMNAHIPTPIFTLGTVMAWYKYVTTKRINELRQTPGTRVWQRNYYEKVVRDMPSKEAFGRYIEENPARWHPPSRD